MRFSDFEPPAPNASPMTLTAKSVEGLAREIAVELQLTGGKITAENRRLLAETIAAAQCGLATIARAIRESADAV